MPAKKKITKAAEPFEKQLVYNTGIPACLWFLRRGRTNTETLFIDASSMGCMEDRTHRAFSDEDIRKIRNCYRSWRILNGELRIRNEELDAYKDEKGFSKSANLADMEKHNFILTPGRYVGIPDEEDDGIPYEEKVASLTSKLTEQIKKEEALNQEIQSQLKKVGIHLEF